MNISQDKADRLNEIVAEMRDLLNEFKGICRHSMSATEYQQFKYRTLVHIEPALMEETEWMTKYSSIDSMEQVAQNAFDVVNSEEETE